MSKLSVSDGEAEFSLHEEEEEPHFNLGLYIGGRNKAGERHGRGWAILPNGDQYDGCYKKGKRHGNGLYVWKGGYRYYGNYRCGHRSGRGMFIYPDGTMYEGNWRNSMPHGKGRYNYANGDTYTGDWYYGKRHGVGNYNFKVDEGCSPILFKGTWVDGVRVGPFQVYFGSEDKCKVLHGTWDNNFPKGPAVFTSEDRYMLMGYFQEPRDKQRMTEYSYLGELEEMENIKDEMQELYTSMPIWHAQEICPYDYSLLPQEPVPLPLVDSKISICSLSTQPSPASSIEDIVCIDEGEEEGEGEQECIPECICECTSETSENPCPSHGQDPCAIEIKNMDKCEPPNTI